MDAKIALRKIHCKIHPYGRKDDILQITMYQKILGIYCTSCIKDWALRIGLPENPDGTVNMNDIQAVILRDRLNAEGIENHANLMAPLPSEG